MYRNWSMEQPMGHLKKLKNQVPIVWDPMRIAENLKDSYLIWALPSTEVNHRQLCLGARLKNYERLSRTILLFGATKNKWDETVEYSQHSRRDVTCHAGSVWTGLHARITSSTADGPTKCHSIKGSFWQRRHSLETFRHRMILKLLYGQLLLRLKFERPHVFYGVASWFTVMRNLIPSFIKK